MIVILFIIHFMTEKPMRTIRSFVLRQGRFTRGQKEAFERLGPEFIVPYDGEKLDFETLFKNRNTTVIEIGFGTGYATAEIAAGNKDVNYIGIEVYRPGVGNLLKYIGDKGLTNIRIFNHDAVDVIENMIEDETVSGFHIFFPDPWHKKKHNKRRLVNRSFTEKISGKLIDGGYIYAVTDWREYGLQMQDVMRSVSSLYSPFEKFADYGNNEVPWRPETRFEEKGLEKNHSIYESYFIKKPR